MFYFKDFYFIILRTVLVFCFISCSAIFSQAQSSDQNFPTPITTNEISGTINARAIGDSRLTTYYFTFNGDQGDIFINVVTKNFNGDLDVFAAEGLRPLTKIVVYADSSDNETGRVIYLRKPEKILLRIQGRTPNDDVATFQIKFAGSFVASSETETDAPKLPEITRENESGVIVNSAGTIIGIKPRPTPEPKDIVVEKTGDDKAEIVEEKTKEEKVAENVDEKSEPRKKEIPRVIITDDLETKNEPKSDETVAKTEDETEEKTDLPDENKEIKTPEKRDETDTVEKEKPKKVKEKTKKEKELEALENIRLVVLLKDGGKIERPMSEILKFGVEKGTLTIIHKDGSISRYSILDVESITIR